jgi:hypothetical protein
MKVNYRNYALKISEGWDASNYKIEIVDKKTGNCIAKSFDTHIIIIDEILKAIKNWETK